MQQGNRQTLSHLKPKYELVTEIPFNVCNTFFVHLTVKKLNTPEYRHYLKLWNEETKPKQENTKDLAKLNQVGIMSVFINSMRNSVQ